MALADWTQLLVSEQIQFPNSVARHQALECVQYLMILFFGIKTMWCNSGQMQLLPDSSARSSSYLMVTTDPMILLIFQLVRSAMITDVSW